MTDIDRRTALKAGALAILTTPLAGLLAGSSGATRTSSLAAPDPALAGSWSAPFSLGGIAIHATLTHSGEVFFFGRPEGGSADHTSYVATWNPATGAIAQAPLPYPRNIFCAGNSVLSNGRVFVAGGHEHDQPDGIGVAQTDTYVPTTRAWSPGPLLSQKRWYPTTVGLLNGRTLIFGGQVRAGEPSGIVNEYNPATNAMIALPDSATRLLGQYPKMHVMPNGRIWKTGNTALTISFDRATNAWSDVATMLYGARFRGNFVLLDRGSRVLAVGGTTGTASPTGTAEVLDASAATPKWRFTGSLRNPRQLANAVTLPDGQVLIVGGGLQDPYGTPVKTPEIYNPRTEVWTALAPQAASRMYHSTALLLPDGRVLSAGQDNGTLATFGEIFSPPYLFRGTRPTISAAPTVIGYGQSLSVTTPQSSTITRVVLMRPGSVTHQTDTDQRSVSLNFTAGTGSLNAQSPANGNLAPRGHYMLFIVNRDGVPSVARWLRVG
jgi:hypothetical protein